jgi:hypothetical protein
MILTHCSKKKDYYNNLDTISATLCGLVNAGISALLNRILESHYFFYNIVPGASQENGGPILCIIVIDFLDIIP